MYDNGIFVVIFLTLTFCKHRPVRNIRQPVIPLTDCGIQNDLNIAKLLRYFVCNTI